MQLNLSIYRSDGPVLERGVPFEATEAWLKEYDRAQRVGWDALALLAALARESHERNACSTADDCQCCSAEALALAWIARQLQGQLKSDSAEAAVDNLNGLLRP